MKIGCIRGVAIYQDDCKGEVLLYMQYEVSMTVSMGRTTNQRKVPKWLSFKKNKSELVKYVVQK